VQPTRKLLSSRQGTVIVALAAGGIAVLVLLTFVHRYKASLDQSAEPVTVLVARGNLAKGSSGDQIARKGLFQATGFQRDRIKEGAITDPASLRGVVATHDIAPGQQLTTADFERPDDPVLSRLAPDERAVTVPLDAAHGMIGQIHAGDRVDVFAGFVVQADGLGRPRPVLRVLLQDVEVLSAPKAVSAKGGLNSNAQTQNIVLRVKEQDAPQVAFTADNGKLWISLRPQAGAQASKPSLVVLDRLLIGKPPIPLDATSSTKTGVKRIYQGGL
jgi:Flp pilus assembly protein CpaB